MSNHFRRQRTWIVGLLASALAMTSIPLAALAEENAPAQKRPNVLVLMCDQLTASVLSCYGGPVPTPNIDRLAREGVRFDEACCPTPFCSPSRASLVTGMYPHAHGIVVNVDDRPAKGKNNLEGFTEKDVTTEKVLSEAGYATHHYGKWHLYGEALTYYTDTYLLGRDYLREMAEVFAKLKGTDPAGLMQWYGHPLPVEVAPSLKQAVASLGDRWKNVQFAEFIAKMGRLKLTPEQWYDVRVADRTVQRIQAVSGQDKPFMITCSFVWPHDPNVVPSPYYEMFDPEKIKLPANWTNPEERFEKEWSRRIIADLGEPGLREFLRIYYASVKLIDDQVGRVLKTLDEQGVTDDTIIVFTADHGDMVGGHGMVWKSTSAFFDEIVRVPLLIRYPARFKPQKCDLAVDLVDLMPTLLDLTGQPIPKEVQGQSLVPFLTGQRDPSTARKYSFSERIPKNPTGARKVEPGTKGSFMIRGQGWKYIRYPNQEFLYHLAEDPGETRNVINEPACSAKRAELSSELDAWLQRTGWPKS